MNEPPPGPALLVDGTAFSPGTTVTLGRDPDSDVVLSDERASRRHAVAELGPQGWVLRDLDSRNGTYVDGRRVDSLRIEGATQVRLGHAETGQVVELALAQDGGDRPPAVSARGSEPAVAGETVVAGPAADSTAPAAPTVPPPHAGRLRIGRHPDNDVVLEGDLRVSRFHAELLVDAAGAWELVDLDSHNGTFVNGTRVARTVLAEGDRIGIGGHDFRFALGTLAPGPEPAGAAFEAIGLAVEVEGGRRILDGVSLYLEPSTLLALVGPSGSGKTTLLNALTGVRPADEGSVWFGGREVYGDYEELRFRIGYVPQEDILHRQLTVRAALRFASELRFPPDVDREERERRIEEVLEELGLTERADLRIDRLSGGQRKRVSVALELLTKPTLLFLDEPTSGLDPGNERELTELFRELAAGGRIVVVVTHSAQSLDLCDRVIFLAAGGRTAYFGPPQEALDYFAAQTGSREYSAIFELLDEDRDADWRGRYEASPLHERYLAAQLRNAELERARRPPPPRPPAARHSWRRQVGVLIRRQLALMRGDRRALALLALQAPLLGVLFAGLAWHNRISTKHGFEATTLLWLIVVGATWLGTSNAIQEIVKELPIYRRERSVGLSIGAYLGAKAGVLGAITAVQATVLAAIALSRQHFPHDSIGVIAKLKELTPERMAELRHFDVGAALASQYLEVLLAVALAGVAAVGLGLLVSALVRSSEQAMALLPLILTAHIVLSFPLLDSSPVLRTLGNASSVEWGTAATASSVSLNELRSAQTAGAVTGEIFLRDLLNRPLSEAEKAERLRRVEGTRERWKHKPDVWLTNMAVLAFLAAISTAGAWWALRRKDLQVLAPGGVRARARRPGGRQAAAAAPRP